MENYKDYARRYGDIPVDQIAAFDIMGCHFNPDKKVDPSLAQDVQKYKAILKEQDRLDKEIQKVLKDPKLHDIYNLFQEMKAHEFRILYLKQEHNEARCEKKNQNFIKELKKDLDIEEKEFVLTKKLLEEARQKNARTFSMLQKLHERFERNRDTKNALAKDWSMEKSSNVNCMAKSGCKQVERQDVIPQIDFSTIDFASKTKRFCTDRSSGYYWRLLTFRPRIQ